jgi:hypothetical protein
MCRNAGQLSLIQRVLTKSYSSGWLAGPNKLPKAFLLAWPGLREPIEARSSDAGSGEKEQRRSQTDRRDVMFRMLML